MSSLSVCSSLDIWTRAFGVTMMVALVSHSYSLSGMVLYLYSLSDFLVPSGPKSVFLGPVGVGEGTQGQYYQKYASSMSLLGLVQ